MKSLVRFYLIVTLVCIGTATYAQSMFKCRLADGSYSYQAERCPESAAQQTITANRHGDLKIKSTELSDTKGGDKSARQPATTPAPLARDSAATTSAALPQTSTQQANTPSPAENNTSAPMQKEPMSKTKQFF